MKLNKKMLALFISSLFVAHSESLAFLSYPFLPLPLPVPVGPDGGKTHVHFFNSDSSYHREVGKLQEQVSKLHGLRKKVEGLQGLHGKVEKLQGLQKDVETLQEEMGTLRTLPTNVKQLQGSMLELQNTQKQETKKLQQLEKTVNDKVDNETFSSAFHLLSEISRGMGKATVLALEKTDAKINKKVDKIEYQDFKKNTLYHFARVGQLMESISIFSHILNDDVSELTRTVAKKVDKTEYQTFKKSTDERFSNIGNFMNSISIYAQVLDDDLFALSDAIDTKVDKTDYESFKQSTDNRFAHVHQFMSKTDNSLHQLNNGLVELDQKIQTKVDKKTFTHVLKKIEGITTSIADGTKAGFKAVELELAKKADKADYETFKKSTTSYLSDVHDFMHAVDESLNIVDDELETLHQQVESIQRGDIDAITAQTKAKIETIALKADKAYVDKIDKHLRNGLAVQAALNGLFPPYDIGKLNISAAMGRYRSSTAVAIGAGYRFNQRLAAKVGAAMGGSHASYNIGVNFVW